MLLGDGIILFLYGIVHVEQGIHHIRERIVHFWAGGTILDRGMSRLEGGLSILLRRDSSRLSPFFLSLRIDVARYVSSVFPLSSPIGLHPMLEYVAPSGLGAQARSI